MTSQLILILTVCWLPALMCWMLVNETRFKKNIVLGVTLPQEAHEDPNVQKELAHFKKTEILIAVLLTALVFLLLIPSVKDWMMTLWMIWIDIVIIAPNIPYVLSHGRLIALKEEKGWKKETKTVRVDTSTIGNERWLSPLAFLPAVIISFLPILFDHGLIAGYVVNGISCILLWFGYRYLYRNKSEMVDDNIELTKALTRIRRYNWGKMWLMIAYLMAAVSLILWLGRRNGLLMGVLTVALAVAVCVFALRLEMRMRKTQERLTASSGSGEYIDEDDKWLGGLIYYNPDDHNAIVNNRIGLNSTVNMASGLGKFMIVMTVLLLLGLPFFGFMLDGVSTQEIRIAKQDAIVEAQAGMTDYKIDLASADEILLLQELPEGLSRRWGTGMDKILKGSFTAKDYSNLTVLLDPTTGPFILIHNADGYYLLGTRDPQLTKELYQSLVR
ncbi:MAG: hypothetical protein IKF18_04750 [Erysipelotrichaceae bacterium]|nr:hypothetical protein [Erysipelotrichaceae bacterium]